ncbi:MAG: hypothetical protein E7361_03830 [Clostridiales bacterium]|nr:hypothetical protein [Clostridiales bacterium]
MENRAQIQKNTFFYNIKRVHFVGIGGISLSALALLSSRLGIVVTGSNNDKNAQLLALSKAGVCVYLGHSADNVPEDCDMLVYSGAVPSNNPEVERARDMRIPVVERSVYLAEISRLYDNVIAIAGSHGKTSTTALIGHIFTIAGLNPTIHIGGNAVGYGNLRIGSTKYFITEACEYRNSMQYLTPNTAVITNVDNDHLDYYKTFRNVVKAFQNFANTASDNLVVGSERFFRKIERGAKLISAGLDAKQTVYATNIVRTKKGSKFDLVVKGKNVGLFELHQWGKHNIKNAVYAIAVSLEYGIGVNIIRKALKSYKGVIW